MSGDLLRWVEVATLDDLWEGEMLEIEVEGERVLLVHLPGGEVRAYQGVCPHQERRLVDGELDGDILVCDGHGWEFDLRSGEGVNPKGCRLYTYEVRREGGSVLVGVPTDGSRRYNRFTAA